MIQAGEIRRAAPAQALLYTPGAGAQGVFGMKSGPSAAWSPAKAGRRGKARNAPRVLKEPAMRGVLLAFESGRFL